MWWKDLNIFTAIYERFESDNWMYLSTGFIVPLLRCFHFNHYKTKLYEHDALINKSWQLTQMFFRLHQIWINSYFLHKSTKWEEMLHMTIVL